MGAQRTQYQIVARAMSGKEVTGYYLQSFESGKQGFYTKEQVAYLVGRDSITNCKGQLYQDKVLLRGVGISLEDLPIVNDDGIKNSDNLGRIRRGTTAADAVNQVNIIGLIVNGRNTLGYIVQNAGGGTANVERNKLLSIAREGKVGNARVQLYRGQMILKGVNCDISALPKYTPQDLGIQ